MPRKLVPGTTIGDLGGGSWESSNTMDEEWDYGCEGGVASTKIDDPERGTIIFEYSVIGGPTSVNYISIEYTATRFHGLDRSEMEHRRAYVDFADKVSKRLLNAPLPETVKNQLLGSKDVKKEQSGAPVGPGYVNTSVSVSQNKNVSIDIHFYEGGESYERNKDK